MTTVKAKSNELLTQKLDVLGKNYWIQILSPKNNWELCLLRLIKGDGEILEEIVTRDRHKQINQEATRGDGQSFQRNTVGSTRKWIRFFKNIFSFNIGNSKSSSLKGHFIIKKNSANVKNVPIISHLLRV